MVAKGEIETPQCPQKKLGEHGVKAKEITMQSERKEPRHYKPDKLTHRIIGAAMAVHSKLGAGLFESIYENALCIEFAKRGIHFERQKRFPVQYEGEGVGEMVVDLIVEQRIIVELKSVKNLAPIHEAQIIAYLKAAKMKRGLLINFNVVSLKSGIRRFSV